MEEVLNFTQIDLVTEDVMLLDTGETLFVWIGLDSNKAEKDAVLMTAKDYLMSDPSERNIDIPIMVVKQSFEPPHFTGYFGAWDADLFPAVGHPSRCIIFTRCLLRDCGIIFIYIIRCIFSKCCNAIRFSVYNGYCLPP